MLMFSHITTSLYVITEPTERQKVCECEKNVYSFITSQNTQQCEVLQTRQHQVNSLTHSLLRLTS